MTKKQAEQITFALEGIPNLGRQRKRTEKFVVKKVDSCIIVKDGKGKTLISFNPFFDGGSIWISDFSSIIMDCEHWGEDKDGKFKLLRVEHSAIANVSSKQILEWKKDSEKLEKIKEVKDILFEKMR